MKFNIHARSVMQKTKGILVKFSYLLNSKYLPQNTKLLLYKVAIRSILAYGFPIWFSISPIVAKELEILERKILRKCVNKSYISQEKRYSNTYIYNTSRVVPFCKYIQSHQKKFVEKLETHENLLMNEIYQMEKHISWPESYYLSPIGILNEPATDVNNEYTLPPFYSKSAPGNHRG